MFESYCKKKNYMFHENKKYIEILLYMNLKYFHIYKNIYILNVIRFQF